MAREASQRIAAAADGEFAVVSIRRLCLLSIFMTPRSDHRLPTQARAPKFEFGFHHPSEGSVLYRAGNTVVLCTASIESKLPPFLEGQGRGWITAEYQMHPRANLRREQRE